MKKLLMTVVASGLLVAVMPATALAHGRHHARHHVRIHHKTFGSDFNQSGSSTSGGTNSGDTAGTVQSFTNGVLTIVLNDGSTVSGQVTNGTFIECRAPETSSTSSNSGWQGHDGRWGDDQGQGDDDNAGAQSCGTSALTQGTVVREAELSVSSAGALWRKVELVTTSSTASASSSSSSSGSCSGQH